MPLTSVSPSGVRATPKASRESGMPLRFASLGTMNLSLPTAMTAIPPQSFEVNV